MVLYSKRPQKCINLFISSDKKNVKIDGYRYFRVISQKAREFLYCFQWILNKISLYKFSTYSSTLNNEIETTSRKRFQKISHEHYLYKINRNLDRTWYCVDNHSKKSTNLLFFWSKILRIETIFWTFLPDKVRSS